MWAHRFYAEFLQATREICDDLGVDQRRVKLTRYETEFTGLDYIAVGRSRKRGFDFHVKTESKMRDPLKGTRYATLDIYYSENAAPFSLHENIDYMKIHEPALPRWAAKAVFDFNLKHNPVNLESVFNGIPIRVYGLPRNAYPSLSEMKALVGGLDRYQKGKIIVYRFRHIIDSNYRAFSYAFLVRMSIHEYWAFFPELGGMDSGGWSIALNETEKMIRTLSRGKRVEVIPVDVEYERLEEFLETNGQGFNFDYKIKQEFAVDEEHVFGPNFSRSFVKFEERLANEDYEQALRDLRALVQTAQEFVIRKKLVIQTERDSSVQKLGSILVDKKVVDEGLRHWFVAFSSVANESSHKLYPSQDDLSDHVSKQRVMVTIQIGRQLIRELEKTVRSPKQEISEVKLHSPNFKVSVKLPRKDGKQIHEESAGLPRKISALEDKSKSDSP